MLKASSHKPYFVFFSLLFLILFSEISLAQSSPCDLRFNDGTGIYQTRLVGQYRDLVLVSDTGAYKIVDVRKIKTVRFNNGNYMWGGAGIGAAVGFVGGVVLYEIFKAKKKKFLTNDAALGIGVFITIPCAIIGGLIGMFFKNIDFYDVSQMNTYYKSKELKYIIKEHSMWR